MSRDVLQKVIRDKIPLTLEEFTVLSGAVENMMKPKPAFKSGVKIANFTVAEKDHLKIRKEFCHFLSSVWHNLPYSSKFDPPTTYVTTDGVQFKQIMEYVGDRLHEFLVFNMHGRMNFDDSADIYADFPTKEGSYWHNGNNNV